MFELKLRSHLPAFARRWLIRFVAGRSALLRSALAERLDRATRSDAPPFMSGIATYLMKLGAPNLGAAWAQPLDRALSQTYAPVMFRLRVESTARLLADGLRTPLRNRPGAPVELIDIGGGPSMDALNALLLLQKDQQGLLDGRRIRVHVLDRDDAGPKFGARALDALKECGGLRGLDVSLSHVRYDWIATSSLETLLGNVGADAVVAASSEGALFDYALPDVVHANLRALRRGTPDDFFMVGDYVVDSEHQRLQRKQAELPIQLCDPQAFAAVIAPTGFRIAATSDAFPGCFRLMKNAASAWPISERRPSATY